jgi:hypothetical protein
MSIESYCIPENEVSSTNITSPSGKYHLNIKSYKIREGSWNCTTGIITRTSDSSIVTTINRNYHMFSHHFIIKDGVEWLLTGRTYLSQCCINLDTAEIYENSHINSFFWAEIMPNPSGTILAVMGCYWGCSYEILFYDFSDPSKGCPLIKIIDYQSDYNLDLHDGYELKWIDDTTVEFTTSQEFSLSFNKCVEDISIEELEDLPEDDIIEKFYYRVVLQKKDDGMHYLTLESSEAHTEQIKTYELFREKQSKFKNDIKASKRFKLLTDSFGDLRIISLSYEDFNLPIDEVRFAVFINDHELHCNHGHVTVRVSDETLKFDTIEEAIAYIQSHK